MVPSLPQRVRQPIEQQHQRLVTRYGRQRVWFWWALLAAVIMLPLILRFGPGPWDGDLLRELARDAGVDQDQHSRLGTWWQCWWQPGEPGADNSWEWERLEPWQYGVLGRWWGGLVCWLVALGLLVGARFWLPSERESSPPRYAGLTRVPRWCGIGMLVALLVALPARLPKMGHSFWHDEVFAAQEYILGDWKIDEESGHAWLQPKDWEATFSGDRLVNNHLLYSVSARVCLELWRFFGGHGPGDWAEWPLRVPSLLAGLATIWLGGWMLARRGRPLAAVLFALILALHPWHAYWSADARGYSMTLFFAVLVVARLLRAFEVGGLLRWTTFGLAEAALLLTYPPMAYFLVAVNLVAVAGIWIGRRAFERRRGLRRWVVGNLIGAAITVFFLAPHVPQFRAYFDQAAEEGRWDSMRRNSQGEEVGMASSWWEDFYSHLIFGQRLASPEMHQVRLKISGELVESLEVRVDHFGSSRADLLARSDIPSGWIRVFVVVVLGVLVLGVFGASRQGWRCAACLLLPAAGSYLCWLATEFAGGYLWTWYLLPVLLSVAWMASLATEAFGKRWRWWAVGPWLAVFACWAWLGHLPRSVHAHHDRMPLRQAVAATRGGAPLGYDEADPDTVVFTLGTASGRVASYDPAVRRIERQKDNLERNGDSSTDLSALARAEHGPGDKKVYVLFCAPHLFVQEYPQVWRQLEGEEWNLVGTFPGTEAQYSYRIYRFAGD